jgi:hypothetical protein
MSNSKLPDGGYTLTNGSNYMLDGFQFDTEYNGGVLEKARLPSAKGITALPTGMIPPNSPLSSDLPIGVEVDLDLDLTEFTKDASEQMIPLVDHSWLASLPEENLDGERSHEDVLKQFAEGRFENTQVNQLKTLQDAWASGSNTGLEILPNTHRKHDKYQNSYDKNQSQLPGDDYRKQVEKGSRKLAYGNKMGDLSESLHGDLNDEYGLHGRVYIKESSFPGLFNGKWNEVINKRCASALYIVANNEDCVFDRFLGKKVVASVQDIPWKEAYRTLMPKLEVYGIKKVSGSSYQSMLKQAFIDYTEERFEQPQYASTWFQIQPDESNLISLDRAKFALDQFEVDNPYIESWQDREQSKEEMRLQRIAKQLVSQNLLEDEIVSDIVEGDRTASDKIQRLYDIATQPVEKSTYEGHGKNASYHTPYKSQSDPNQQVKTSTERDVEALSRKCQEKVAKLIQSGLISISEVEEVTKTASQPEDKLSAVYEYLAQPSKVQTYMGEVEAHYMGKKSSLDPNAQIVSREDQNLASRHKVTIAKISKLVSSGLISHDEVAIAIKGKKLPEDRVASIFEYLAKPKQVQSYDGHINKAHIITSTNKMPTAKVDATFVTEGRKIEASIDHYVSNGFISEEQAETALKIASETKKYETLYNLVIEGVRAKKSDFKGQKYSAHISKRASAPTKTAHEAQSDKVATWLRQKMSEGSAGQELDLLLSTRFSQTVLSDHKERIASLRSEHEGISGHAYVDSEAYMTQGTDGCDKGALLHRANQIPTLLKNAKCGGCVSNVGGTCQKYNKLALDQSNEIVEDKVGYQREMIRLANSSDAERTASLFVNNFDEGEFNLQQDHNVDFSDAPSLDKVGEVLFGGFEI